MQSDSLRSGALWRACAVVGFGLLGGWALDPRLTLSAGRGDWAVVSEGLRATLDGRALGSSSRALLHVHDLGADPAQLVLIVAGRARRQPSVLRIERDGQSFLELPLTPEPRAITVPVLPPRGGVDVALSLEAQPAGAQLAVFDIHAMRVERRVGPGRRMLPLLPLFASLLVFLGLAKRTPAFEAVAWAAVAAFAAAAGAIVAFDPILSIRFAADSRQLLRLAALVLVWALALRSDPPRWRGPLAAALTVGILYFPALRFGFVTDDFLFGRPLRVSELLSTLWDQWDPKGKANAHYRPVLAFSFALDYALWGARTIGWHLSNLIVQTLGAVLAGAFLRRLGLPPRAALAGTLAWAAHPLGACAASWSNERTDGLLSVFFLATLVTLLAPRFTRVTLAATCCFGLLALGSKEAAVMLPVCAALVLAMKAVTTGEPLAAASGETSRRRAAVGLLALLAVVHASYWVRLFPTKAASGAGLSQRLAELGGHGGLDAVASFLVPVFLPRSYGDWSGTTIDQQPLLYLLVGSVIGPLGLVWLWRSGAPRRLFGIAALGLLWPLVNVAPLLPLRGGLDLYRLGLLLALGFGLWFASIFAALEATRPRLAVALALGLGCGFAPLAIDASSAWGPGGFAYRAGLSWKRGDPGWRGTIGEEMWRLSETQIEAEEHTRTLLGPGGGR